MLATLAFLFTSMAEESTVLSATEQQQVAVALEEDAQVMSNTQLQEVIAGQPEATQAEIVSINTVTRPRALQVALLVPFIAGVVGLLLSFRSVRLPDIAPSASLEGVLGG
jgi:hypothetical protein